jgi:hypothetical protein
MLSPNPGCVQFPRELLLDSHSILKANLAPPRKSSPRRPRSRRRRGSRCEYAPASRSRKACARNAPGIEIAPISTASAGTRAVAVIDAGKAKHRNLDDGGRDRDHRVGGDYGRALEAGRRLSGRADDVRSRR